MNSHGFNIGTTGTCFGKLSFSVVYNEGCPGIVTGDDLVVKTPYKPGLDIEIGKLINFFFFSGIGINTLICSYVKLIVFYQDIFNQPDMDILRFKKRERGVCLDMRNTVVESCPKIFVFVGK
ncbi:hypothetical protein SDC9_126371 [bioreactor metagenome]|uniref:Uncharacterized protein n=1 Tax=bioreactor metagenome TaxID=1076179 RepID=A0A645CR09_9ZZZZ